VAVPVGSGVFSGVDVAEGVTVGPMDIGKLLQAVRTSAIRSPKEVRKCFIGVLILVNNRRVNGKGVYGEMALHQLP
jgi:hypothetical protein